MRKRSFTPVRGFTLLELMLTLLIVAIVMMFLGGVVVSTIRAQQTVEELTYSAEIGPSLLASIRRDLEAAILPDSEEEYFKGVDRGSSSDAQDRLDFAAAVMSYGAEDEYSTPVFQSVNEVGYQLLPSRSDPGQNVLYRREDPWIDAEPLQGGRLIEMYHRVRSFNVTYYDGEEWVDEWATKDREGNFPKAIKVELRVVIPRGGGGQGTHLRHDRHPPRIRVF